MSQHFQGPFGPLVLKVHGAIFFKIEFAVSFEELSLQRCKFRISVEMVKLFGRTKQFCILQLPISYCVSLIMVNITRDIFINIFQTEHFSAVKFAMGYEKNTASKLARSLWQGSSNL